MYHKTAKSVDRFPVQHVQVASNPDGMNAVGLSHLSKQNTATGLNGKSQDVRSESVGIDLRMSDTNSGHDFSAMEPMQPPAFPPADWSNSALGSVKHSASTSHGGVTHKPVQKAGIKMRARVSNAMPARVPTGSATLTTYSSEDVFRSFLPSDVRRQVAPVC